MRVYGGQAFQFHTGSIKRCNLDGVDVEALKGLSFQFHTGSIKRCNVCRNND